MLTDLDHSPIRRRSRHPVDAMRAEGTTCLDALEIRIVGARFERDLLWITDPVERAECRTDPSIYQPAVFDALIAETERAEEVYAAHAPDGGLVAVAALRFRGLTEYADALESGDYAEFLAV